MLSKKKEFISRCRHQVKLLLKVLNGNKKMLNKMPLIVFYKTQFLCLWFNYLMYFFFFFMYCFLHIFLLSLEHIYIYTYIDIDIYTYIHTYIVRPPPLESGSKFWLPPPEGGSMVQGQVFLKGGGADTFPI